MIELFRNIYRLRKIKAGFLIAIIVAFATGLQSCGKGGWEDPEDIQREEAEKLKTEQELQKINMDRAAQEHERALTMSRLQKLRSEAEDVLHVLDEIDTEIDLWEKTIPPLFTNEEGRSLAAKPGYVAAFKKAYENFNEINTHKTQEVRKQINEILLPIRENIEKEEPYLSDKNDKEFNNIIESEKENAKTSFDQLKRDRRMIEDMVRIAKKDYSGGSITLNDAIEAENQRDSLTEAARIARAQEDAREEAIKQKEAAAKEKERAIANAELKKQEEEKRAAVIRIETERERIKADNEERLAELEREKDKIKTETILKEKQHERERLLSLASDKNIQAKYLPFLGKGRSYLRRHSSGYFSSANSSVQLVPVSYSKLVDYGAFNTLDSFVKIGTCSLNDRPTWPKPNTEKDVERYKELFAEFKELAPIWLEMGLLRK